MIENHFQFFFLSEVEIPFYLSAEISCRVSWIVLHPKQLKNL